MFVAAYCFRFVPEEHRAGCSVSLDRFDAGDPLHGSAAIKLYCVRLQLGDRDSANVEEAVRYLKFFLMNNTHLKAKASCSA